MLLSWSAAVSRVLLLLQLLMLEAVLVLLNGASRSVCFCSRKGEAADLQQAAAYQLHSLCWQHVR
jgi:hypothetical protein